MESLNGKHISILGKGQSGVICPFDADEVWGVNNVVTQHQLCPVCNNGKVRNDKGQATATICPNCNGTNEVLMYPKKIHKSFAFDAALEEAYINTIKPHSMVVSTQPWADIKYPLEEVLAEFKTRYFTNSISYMVALAIYLKVAKVSIYGVDVSFGAPYAQENRGVEYWVGRAQERGIEVYCPPKSHLLRTVYGNLYGEIGACNMLLYVHERLNLINLLPKAGHYSDSIKANAAWWVLFPKEDEAKAHGLQVMKDPAGNMTFQCAQGEYVQDVQMPPEVWEYIRSLLIDIEAKGELPFGGISVYEKIVLGKETVSHLLGREMDNRTSRPTPSDLIHASEQKRDQDFARISKEYVDAINKAEDDLENGPKKATNDFRAASAAARVAFDLAIKTAEEELAKANAKANEIYSGSSARIADDYRTSKANARETHARLKTEIEERCNREIEELSK